MKRSATAPAISLARARASLSGMRFWLCLSVVGLAGGCTPKFARPTQLEIWQAIQSPARRYDIEPELIHALVAAESNFVPDARNGDARGLLQLKPEAWSAVSTLPYEPNVWDWRTNLEVGIDYLAYARSYIHRKSTFSYPRLLAAFHYGLDYLEGRNFNVDRVPVPDNNLYRQLWSGNLSPLAPPK